MVNFSSRYSARNNNGTTGPTMFHDMGGHERNTNITFNSLLRLDNVLFYFTEQNLYFFENFILMSQFPFRCISFGDRLGIVRGPISDFHWGWSCPQNRDAAKQSYEGGWDWFKSTQCTCILHDLGLLTKSSDGQIMVAKFFHDCRHTFCKTFVISQLKLLTS